MQNPTDRIVPLDQLDDFRVAEGDPDVRGWDVISADGKRIGEVDNLLVDTGAMKVRYLDVEVDTEMIESDKNRHILIPVGYARLDESEDQVRVDSLDSSRLREFPEYRQGQITSEFETDIQNQFGAGAAGVGGFAAGMERGSGGREFLGERKLEEDGHVTRSEEELEIGKHEERAGEVRLGKHVETEHVSRRVPVRHEEVVIEHRPASERMGAEPKIGEDGEVRIPINEERLDVEKHVVPQEDVVVRKQERIDEETIEADLRRERVDIDREGDVDLRDRP